MSNSFLHDNQAIDIDFPTFFDSLSNAIGIRDEHSVHIALNDLFMKVAGIAKPEEIIGTTGVETDCPSAKDFEIFMKQDKIALSTNRHQNIDIYPYLDRDNEISAFFVDRKKIIDKKKRNFVLISATRLPLSHCRLLVSFLSQHDPQFQKSPMGSFDLNTKVQHQGLIDLTQRQAECLFYLVRGRSNKEIARILHRSIRTIEEHIENLKNIFNCQTKSQLIEKSFEIGIAKILPPSVLQKIIQYPYFTIE